MATNNGSNRTVTGTASTLASAQPVSYGVQITADSGNAGTVYVGNNANITAGSAAATDGYQLAAGASVFIPKVVAADLSLIYVIGSGGTQVVYFLWS